jgi:Ohr subfamily peroxiredoxin
MSRSARIVYTAKTKTTGGRDNGAARSSDGLLDIRFSTPGSARIGTNPEQLIAAGWSASLASAVVQAARERQIALPAELVIEAEVSLSTGDGGSFLGVRLAVSLPGVERASAQGLIDAAQAICPFSRATLGNVDLAVELA